MNRAKTRFLSALILLVMLLAACTLAQAAVASAPDQSRIRTHGPDGLAYEAVYNASRHSLHFEINGARSDLAALKAYAEDPESGWNSTPTRWAVDVALTPPSGAVSVQSWIYDSKMNDSMLYTAVCSEPKTPVDRAEPLRLFVGSYLRDGDRSSLLPTRHTADEQRTIACRWLDADGEEIGFEKLHLTADWDSMKEIPLDSAAVLSFPPEERVTWRIAEGVVFATEPSYDPETGILSAVIDTAKTNWPLVISSSYYPGDKTVSPFQIQMNAPENAAKMQEINYGGGVQIGDVIRWLDRQWIAEATSGHAPGEIGRYEESSSLFFPEAPSVYRSHGSLVNWLDENGSRLQVDGSAMPYEAVRFDITFTDSDPFKVILEKVPSANIVPDIQKIGVKTEVSTGSVKYFNEDRTTGYQAYETAILVPETTEDTSDWQAYGRNNSMLYVAEPSETGLPRRAALFTQGVENENIYSGSEVFIWKNAAGEVKAIQVLDIFISQGDPKLWPEYSDEINPFPASQVSVFTIDPVDGTSVTYDSARGIVRLKVDSEKVVAAAADGANLFDVYAGLTLRFTPPEGAVSYGVQPTGNSILFGEDWLERFKYAEPEEDMIYPLPANNIEESWQSFFRATTFELPDNRSAEYYYSINPDYAGNEYGGHVDIYYWFDAQGNVLGRNYVAFQYDPVELITTSEVLESEDELSDEKNGKKKPLIIADGKALGYGQGKLDLRAERSPSSEGTHRYELCLVNDADAEVKLKGKGTLYLPYPEGYDETNYTDLSITIAHYNADGSEIVETFSLEDGSITPTKHGLRIEITSLSPFVVSWEEPEPEPTPTVAPTPTPAPTAAPPASGSMFVEATGFTAADLTEDLKAEGYASVKDVEIALMAELISKGISSSNTALYEVKLMYWSNGEKLVADAAHFPLKDGKPCLHVLMDLPEGTTPTHRFKVIHMFASNALGKTAGTVETPDVNVVYVDGKPQLSFYVTGLSPVMVGWTAPAPVPQTGDATPLATLIALMVLSAGAFTLIGKKRRSV